MPPVGFEPAISAGERPQNYALDHAAIATGFRNVTSRKCERSLMINVSEYFWWGNVRERDHWGDPDIDGRIILRWIFRKWNGVVETGWSWLRIGTGGGRLWVR